MRPACPGTVVDDLQVQFVGPVPDADLRLGRLEKVVAIRRDGLAGLRQLAAVGPAADQARQQAFVQAYQQVIADYQAAAQAALQGNMTAFRADFGRVAPHGYPTGPDAKALDHASAPFPFKSCGMSGGL